MSTWVPSVTESVNLCTLCKVWAHSEFVSVFIYGNGFGCVVRQHVCDCLSMCV